MSATSKNVTHLLATTAYGEELYKISIFRSNPFFEQRDLFVTVYSMQMYTMFVRKIKYV